MRTVMVISPHADDAAAFCGGTIARFADEGWNVIILRITDDRRDSTGITVEETVRRNTEELRTAATILGVSAIEELRFESDSLADVPLRKLRERLVYHIRKHRPYAVFGFDPGGLYEGNQDHVRVAIATEEAYWVAAFDLHHPEHFTEGLSPFSVCERWYFARRLAHPNRVEDVSAYMDRKIDALCAHRTMLTNLIQSYRLQLHTWGRWIDRLDQSMTGDQRELIALFLQTQAQKIANKHGLPREAVVEEYRMVRFGDIEEMFQGMAEPITDAQTASVREDRDSDKPRPRSSRPGQPR